MSWRVSCESVYVLLETRHALDKFLSLGLVWIKLLLLLLHRVHVHFAQVLALVQILVQCIWGVDWRIFLSSIFASVLQDDLGSSRMLGQKIGHVISEIEVSRRLGSYQESYLRSPVDYDPAGLAVVVLCYLLARELDSLGVIARMIHLGWEIRMLERQD